MVAGMNTRINLEAANGAEAKRIKNMMAKIHACKVKTLSTPVDSKHPIRMEFECPPGVIDSVLDNLKEPHVLAKTIPDEISLNPKWNWQKRRKIKSH